MDASKQRLAAVAWALALALLAAMPLASQRAWADDGLQAGDATGLQAQATVVASGVAGTCPWELDSEGTLTVFPGDYEANFDMTEQKVAVRRIVYRAEGDREVVATKLRFNSFPWLKSIDTSGLDTSGMTDMSFMFYELDMLESIDLSGLDTSNVTNMSSMFHGCTSLKSLDLSGLDTSNVTDMNDMFGACSSLKSLDLSVLDTSSVEDMSDMFFFCSSLESLDLSCLDISNVTTMSCLFENSKSLRSVNMSGLKAPKLLELTSMFARCPSLKSVDLSGLEAPNVESMNYMFSDCKSLTSVSLPNRKASLRADMNSMFEGCTSLKTLNLSKLNSPMVESMSNMFSGCTSLSTLDISGFITTQIKREGMKNAFKGCQLRKLTLGVKTKLYSGCELSVGTWVKAKDKQRLKTAAFIKASGVRSAAGAWTLKGKASQVITAKNVTQGVWVSKGTAIAFEKVTVDLKKEAGVSAGTAVKYAKANKAGGNLITVNAKTGKVALKKGLKIGTYKVKVKLTAAASKYYKAAKAKTITLTVNVTS